MGGPLTRTLGDWERSGRHLANEARSASADVTARAQAASGKPAIADSDTQGQPTPIRGVRRPAALRLPTAAALCVASTATKSLLVSDADVPWEPAV